jgi:hypothetical protein
MLTVLNIKMTFILSCDLDKKRVNGRLFQEILANSMHNDFFMRSLYDDHLSKYLYSINDRHRYL